MAVLSGAFVLWMGVIVKLRVAARIEYIALGVMVPFVKCRALGQQLANDIVAGISQNTYSFKHFTASLEHGFKLTPRQTAEIDRFKIRH
jgi:hypothetical protein